MRAVLQRVREASVRIEGAEVARIGTGLLILLGVMNGDGEAEVNYLAAKCADLRIFIDEEGKMNRSVVDAGGEVIVVSQFTLAASTKKGRRPSFVDAAPPDLARPLVDSFVALIRSRRVRCETGVFGADMKVALTNDGPVTIWIDTAHGA